MRIVYRGVYAGIPAAALHTGNLAWTTDLLVMFQSSGVAWIPYHDYPDYQGEKAGLYPQPGWSAEEGTDINLRAFAAGRTWGQFASVAYAVPAGQTLYLVDFTWESVVVTDTDYDHFLYSTLHVEDLIVPTSFLDRGGVGGGGAHLSKPIVIPALHQVQVRTYNRANLTCNLTVCALGYEV